MYGKPEVGDIVEYAPKMNRYLKYEGTIGVVEDVDDSKVYVRWDNTSSLYKEQILMRKKVPTPMVYDWIEVLQKRFVTLIPEPLDEDII